MNSLEEKRVKVVGIASNKVLSLFKSVLDIKDNDIALFCSFSEFDIPIGYEFNFIEDMNGDDISSGKVILEKVSQGYIMPFDMIPRGHKTVCKFSLPSCCVESLHSSLPIINDWYESNVYVFLK